MAEIDKLTMLKVQRDMRNPPAERITQLEQLLEEKTERWMYLNELKEKIDAQDT